MYYVYKVVARLLKGKYPKKALSILYKIHSTRRGKSDISLLFEMAILSDTLEYYGLGVLSDNGEDYEKAVEFYEKAVSIDPEYSNAYFFLANSYDELGEKGQAIKNYKKVIELEPQNFWAYNNLGSIYEEIGQYNLALGMFKRSLEIWPNHYKALFNIGVVMNKIGYREKAIEYYRASMKENDKYPYSFLNLAVLYKDEENYQKAVEIISEGIESNKEESFLYYNRACFLAHLNRLEESMQDLITATTLSPCLIEYMKADEELGPVKKLKEYGEMWAWKKTEFPNWEQSI